MMTFTFDGSDKFILIIASFDRVMRGDYTREDTQRIRDFVNEYEKWLDDADIHHSQSVLKRSDIRAAFTDRVQPLFGGRLFSEEMEAPA